MTGHISVLNTTFGSTQLNEIGADAVIPADQVEVAPPRAQCSRIGESCKQSNCCTWTGYQCFQSRSVQWGRKIDQAKISETKTGTKWRDTKVCEAFLQVSPQRPLDMQAQTKSETSTSFSRNDSVLLHSSTLQNRSWPSTKISRATADRSGENA